MARARNCGHEHFVARIFRRMNPSNVCLDQHRFVMCSLPYICEPRINLDARDESKVAMARDGSRERPATREYFQRRNGGRAAADVE